MYIRNFEKFKKEKDIEEKTDTRSEYTDFLAENLKQSQDYIEYVADFLNNGSGIAGSYGSSGKSGTSGASGCVDPTLLHDVSAYQGNSTSSGRYVGKSRINGENLYLKEDKKPLETIYKKQQPQIDNEPKDNFGDWTKSDSKPLPLYEKWMIGIGIVSLIIGIITVVIMIAK